MYEYTRFQLVYVYFQFIYIGINRESKYKEERTKISDNKEKGNGRFSDLFIKKNETGQFVDQIPC